MEKTSSNRLLQQLSLPKVVKIIVQAKDDEFQGYATTPLFSAGLAYISHFGTFIPLSKGMYVNISAFSNPKDSRLFFARDHDQVGDGNALNMKRSLMRIRSQHVDS